LIRNLEITAYTAQVQQNTVQLGDGSTIENCSIHHCAGPGAWFWQQLHSSQQYHSYLEQQGIGAGGDASLVEGNEISFCNYNRQYDPGFSAGGTKFWASTNYIIRNNYVHDNQGPAVGRCNNDNITYEGNIVINNAQSGIFHEIGWKATIRCNMRA